MNSLLTLRVNALFFLDMNKCYEIIDKFIKLFIASANSCFNAKSLSLNLEPVHSIFPSAAVAVSMTDDARRRRHCVAPPRGLRNNAGRKTAMRSNGSRTLERACIVATLGTMPLGSKSLCCCMRTRRRRSDRTPRQIQSRSCSTRTVDPARILFTSFMVPVDGRRVSSSSPRTDK
jgi:hypothetical protein